MAYGSLKRAVHRTVPGAPLLNVRTSSLINLAVEHLYNDRVPDTLRSESYVQMISVEKILNITSDRLSNILEQGTPEKLIHSMQNLWLFRLPNNENAYTLNKVCAEWCVKMRHPVRAYTIKTIEPLLRWLPAKLRHLKRINDEDHEGLFGPYYPARSYTEATSYNCKPLEATFAFRNLFYGSVFGG